MQLESISIENFKKLRQITLELSDINYLVGGNNSGKSSVLQAIHCAITAAQSQIENDGARLSLRSSSDIPQQGISAF